MTKLYLGRAVMRRNMDRKYPVWILNIRRWLHTNPITDADWPEEAENFKAKSGKTPGA